MHRRWMLLLLAFVFIGLEETVAQFDGVKPQNVTVEPSTRSLQVRWKPPSWRPGDLDSYRVRIYPTQSPNRRRSYQIPVEPDPVEVVSCLEPNTQYKVQVYTRYRSRSNVSEDTSVTVLVTTLPAVELDLLDRVWGQRIYVLIGAIMMVVLVLLVTPCLCCCYARKAQKRKSWRARLDLDDKQKKSATELHSRADSSDPDNRYVPEPTRAHNFHTYSPRSNSSTNRLIPSSSSTNHLSSAANTLPPSYSRANHSTPSIPAECAPGRPPLPVPGRYAGNDVDEYQDDVFAADPADQSLYSNQAAFFPEPESGGIYGNVRY